MTNQLRVTIHWGRITSFFLSTLLVFTNVVTVALILYKAAFTPSVIDPARSELSNCIPLVLWRIAWCLIVTVTCLPPSWHSAPLVSRRRGYAALVAVSWSPLGFVLLAKTRTRCATAAPETWAHAQHEVRHIALPSSALVALVGSICVFKYMRDRRESSVQPLAAVPARETRKEREKGAGESVMAVDAKL